MTEVTAPRTSLIQLSQQSVELEKELIKRDGEIDELFEEFLKIHSIESKEKIDSCMFFLDHLKSRLEYFAAFEKDAKTAKKSIESALDRMKDYLIMNMDILNTNELVGNTFRYMICDNPVALVIESEEQVPDHYKTRVTSIQINREEIKKDLKAGFNVPGCKLESKRSARKYLASR